jgi:pimeloyl-ACP methyl ester carboxylesterase
MRARTVLLIALIACMSNATAQASAQEDCITTQDGVRLFFRSIGPGDGEPLVITMAVYLSDALRPLAVNRRVIFYDLRGRGRSDAADSAVDSLDRQIADLEELRAALGIARMALFGWSRLGMEMAVYAIRHSERVTRLAQVVAVPPRADQMEEAGGDTRAARMDTAALLALERRAEAGEFVNDPAHTVVRATV